MEGGCPHSLFRIVASRASLPQSGASPGPQRLPRCTPAALKVTEPVKPGSPLWASRDPLSHPFRVRVLTRITFGCAPHLKVSMGRMVPRSGVRRGGFQAWGCDLLAAEPEDGVWPL